MTHSLRHIALLSLLLVAPGMAGACGGSTVIGPDDATTGSGGSGGTGADGGAGPTAGGGDTSGGGGEGGTGGGVGGSGGSLPEGCPPIKPTQPGACAPEGLKCDYGGFCNFVDCLNGSWQFPLC
jgi:hypothetical protein